MCAPSSAEVSWSDFAGQLARLSFTVNDHVCTKSYTKHIRIRDSQVRNGESKCLLLISLICLCKKHRDTVDKTNEKIKLKCFLFHLFIFLQYVFVFQKLKNIFMRCHGFSTLLMNRGKLKCQILKY